jgi:hypothetical protein
MILSGLLGLYESTTEKSKVVPLLVHIASTAPYTESTLCFASQTAFDIIVRKNGTETKHRMEYLLATCYGNPLTAALCECVFETYTLGLLEKGGHFDCHQLVGHASKRSWSVESTLEIARSVKSVVDRVSTDQTRHRLYVPKSTNYTAIDAWIPGLGGFQITIGKESFNQRSSS